MKRIKSIIRNWYYRRLYKRLFFHYAGLFQYADEAAEQSSNAFLWLTGHEWKDVC